MAFQPRSIAQIQASIIASKNSQAALNPLTSTSQVSYWNLWSWIMAVAIALLEQIMLIFFGEINTIEAMSHGGTAAWIQAQILLFEYPNVVTINPDFSINYNPVNTALQIISNCAVTASNSGVLTIKATTGGTTPTVLTSNQIIALQSYLDTIISPNQFYIIISQTADIMVLIGTVFYNGQFNATIQTNVIAALNNYIAQFTTLPANGGNFNGVVKMSDIENVILGVQGVVDWQPLTISITPSVGSPPPSYLINNGLIVSRNFQTVAGYIAETDSFVGLSFQVANN